MFSCCCYLLLQYHLCMQIVSPITAAFKATPRSTCLAPLHASAMFQACERAAIHCPPACERRGPSLSVGPAGLPALRAAGWPSPPTAAGRPSQSPDACLASRPHPAPAAPAPPAAPAATPAQQHIKLCLLHCRCTSTAPAHDLSPKVLFWQGNTCKAASEHYLHQGCLPALLHGSAVDCMYSTPGLLSRDILLSISSCSSLRHWA